MKLFNSTSNLLKILNNFSIRHKLLIIIMVITFASVILTSIIFVIHDLNIVKKNSINEIKLLSTVIGKRSALPVKMNLKSKIQDNLSDFDSKKAIVGACIFNLMNELIATYSSEGNHKNHCTITNLENVEFKGGYLFVSTPIISIKGNSVGNILVISDLSEFKEHLITYLINVIILLLSVLTIAYITAIQLQKIISIPLAHLTDTTENIIKTKEYLTKAKKYSQDEIGKLTDSFNKMLNEIHVRDKQLNNANKNLEFKVKERTKDLEESQIKEIKARRRAEKEKEKAVKANNLKNEFIRNMSHEFRTPLHHMLSFSEYGVQEHQTAQRSELNTYFTRIHAASERLYGLVKNILDIAHIESGKMDFELNKYNMDNLISDVILMFEASSKKKNVTLKKKISNLNDMDLVCDKNKITQVLVNLIGNAEKFAPAESAITISANKTTINRKQAIEVSISDEGVGIPEKELKEIFGKFFQSTRTKTSAGGTGLGLTICFGFITGHGGKIWAENNKDKGAAFKFIIPVKSQKGLKTIIEK